MTERAFHDVDLTVEQGDEFLRLTAETSTLPVAPAGSLPPLAACPFCGAAETVLTDDGTHAWVRCSFCQTTGPLGHTATTAAVAWNTRAAADVTALVEEVLKKWRYVRNQQTDSLHLPVPKWQAERAETQAYVDDVRERLARALVGRG